MKNKKAKIIIIAVALVAVIAGVVLGIVGYNAGWFSPSDELSVNQIFDETNSYVVRDEYYNRKGELEYKVLKGYSDENKEILAQESYLTAEDKLFKSVYYTSDGKISSVDEFNDLGKVIVHHNYANGEATGEYSKYDYTDSGLALSSTDYNANNEIVKQVNREYNANDKITLYHETDAEGNTLSKTVYEYNSKGFESKATFYDNEGMTGFVTYEYDSQDRLVKMSEHVRDGSLNNYRTYTYDENGASTEEFHQVG